MAGADDTTIRPRKPAARADDAVAPYLTVLWHPERERVGDVAPLAAKLSRLEPDFAPPGGSTRAPLGDPHVSRTPAVLTATRGGVRIDAPAVVELLVDGAPPPVEVDAQALARGVVVELAGRVALLLHARKPPAATPSLGLVGASDAIDALRAEIARVADLDVPVLIEGETGAGKERVARALHDGSSRARQPFVAVNMATLAPAMAAAQLFGHAKGAFTGADRAHVGLFAQAHGGTLFLDEVADAPAEVQAMLLRVLETGDVQPIGAETAQRVDVRVIAATDADLASDGEFRAQLYHRLAGYRIAVPPLRARVDDLGRLLASFGAPAELPVAALRAYASHAWPGNVRELANVARHLAVVGRGGTIPLAIATAPLGTREPAPAGPVEITDDTLVAALAAHRWKTSAAATALGISRTTLYALMDRSARIRKARDLARDEIAACHDALRGDLDAMSARLQVSKRGLQLRMRELGL